MNTGERASAPAKETTTRPTSTNPVDFFELHAKAIWLSADHQEEKASKLYTLSDTIRKYLRKIDIELIGRKPDDEWSRLSALRARAYLNQLSEDIRKLAIVCQRNASSFLTAGSLKTLGQPGTNTRDVESR